MLVAIVVLFITSGISGAGEIQSTRLQYGQVVVLSGKITKKIFPGPPSYESVKAGDSPLVCWFLKLERPICVEGQKTQMPENQSEKDVRLLHLDISEAQEKLLGQVRRDEAVEITGKLYHGIRVTHKTPVMLEVSAIEPKQSSK